MQLDLIDKKGSVDVSEAAFGQEFKEALVHQVVTAYLAGGRAGTHAQKTRSEVRGGGRKPWRQKGTGRARAGTIRSPIWRGGGITFAAKTRDYSQKVNKKMYRGAIVSIISELLRLKRLFAIDKLEIKEPKTKDLLTKLDAFQLEGRILIVLAEVNDNIQLAARNLTHVDVCTAATLDPVRLVKFDNVLMTSSAIKKIEEQLG